MMCQTIIKKTSQCKHDNPIRQSIQKKYHEMNPS